MGNSFKIVARALTLVGLGMLGFSFYNDYKISEASNNGNDLQPPQPGTGTGTVNNNTTSETNKNAEIINKLNQIPGVHVIGGGGLGFFDNQFKQNQTNLGQNPSQTNNSANVQKEDFAQKFTKGVEKFKQISAGVFSAITAVALVIQSISGITNYIKGNTKTVQIPNNNNNGFFNNNNGFSNINNNGYFKNQYAASQQVFLENNRKQGFGADENGVIKTDPSIPYAFVRVAPQCYSFVPKSSIPGYVD